MKYISYRFRSVAIGVLVLTVLLPPSPVWAVPASFDWGSFNSTGSTNYGVYDTDNVTILQTGDLAQLVWAGPDGVINLPYCDGIPGGDDQLLDTNTIQNAGSLPPPARNKGYLPLRTYSFDTEDSQSGGVAYIRAWNANAIEGATAYGNSGTVTLSSGDTFNAARWHTDKGWNWNASAQWIGPMNGDWHDGNSWTSGCTPRRNTPVDIPTDSSVLLSANGEAKSLVVGSNAVLDLTTYELTVESGVTNNGTLKQTKNVPTGSTTEFLRITDTTGTTTSYFGVEMAPDAGGGLGSTVVATQGNQVCASPPDLGQDPIKRCFDIQLTSDQSATVRLYYLISELNGNDPSKLSIYHEMSNLWHLEEGTHAREAGGVTYNWVQVTGVDQYSRFTAGDQDPTLVKLVSFNATAYKGRVQVAWETSSEIDIVGFDILRSQTLAGQYVQLYEVLIESHGGPTWGASYIVDDTNVIDGVTYYYKLQEMDINGQSTLHGPIPTAVTQSPVNSVYLPLVMR